jgi:hypothetical protein
MLLHESSFFSKHLKTQGSSLTHGNGFFSRNQRRCESALVRIWNRHHNPCSSDAAAQKLIVADAFASIFEGLKTLISLMPLAGAASSRCSTVFRCHRAGEAEVRLTRD